jgi:hypothetical protein
MSRAGTRSIATMPGKDGKRVTTDALMAAHQKWVCFSIDFSWFLIQFSSQMSLPTDPPNDP